MQIAPSNSCLVLFVGPELVQSPLRHPVLKLMHRFTARTRYWLLFFALLLLSFLALQKLAGYTFMRINVANSQSAYLTVYWTTAAEPDWSESRARALYVNSRKRNFVLPIPVVLSQIKRLRVDPSFVKNIRTEIRQLSLYSIGVKSVHFDTPGAFKAFNANQDVGQLDRRQGLFFRSQGNNAELVAELSAEPLAYTGGLMLAQSALMALLLMSLITRFPWLFQNLRWVPAGLLVAAGAALTMASITNINTHPDEKTHIDDALYYASHYSPPKVCDPQTLYTHTAYGVSRLDKREIAYYVAGRYLQLLAFVPGQDYLKLRYLNVAMLFILAWLAFRNTRARYLMTPLLLTPQAWYLFSYYNSDALSLFAVTLLAYQVFVPQSMLRRLLNGERPPGTIIWILGLALIVAMQYWVKLNYMFYPILLLMLAAAWWLLNRRLPGFQYALPIVIALLFGTSLYAGWEYKRHSVNDFATSRKIAECMEITAATRFKPSTPLNKLDPGLRLRERGISLSDMLIKWQWAKRTFYTGLGAYGYTEFLNSDRHYRLAGVLLTLFFLYVILNVAIRGDAMARLSVLSVLAAMAGITFAAIINNWTQSFQTQGRYLMVYLPLLGSLMAMYPEKLNEKWLSLLALAAFMLGLYSFYAVGLIEVPH